MVTLYESSTLDAAWALDVGLESKGVTWEAGSGTTGKTVFLTFFLLSQDKHMAFLLGVMGPLSGRRKDSTTRKVDGRARAAPRGGGVKAEGWGWHRGRGCSPNRVTAGKHVEMGSVHAGDRMQAGQGRIRTG